MSADRVPSEAELRALSPPKTQAQLEALAQVRHQALLGALNGKAEAPQNTAAHVEGSVIIPREEVQALRSLMIRLFPSLK